MKIEKTQKKIIFDVNTDMISSQYIFKDFRQELIFKFQYLINTFINKKIAQYKEKNKLDESLSL